MEVVCLNALACRPLRCGTRASLRCIRTSAGCPLAIGTSESVSDRATPQHKLEIEGAATELAAAATAFGAWATGEGAWSAAVNAVLAKATRHLNQLIYAANNRFTHDAADVTPVLGTHKASLFPVLNAAANLGSAPAQTDDAKFAEIAVCRQANWAVIHRGSHRHKKPSTPCGCSLGRESAHQRSLPEVPASISPPQRHF